MRIVNEKGKTIYLLEIGQKAGYRERIAFAAAIAECHNRFGNNQRVEGRYDAYRDKWFTTGGNFSVSQEASVSRKILEKAGFAFVDKEDKPSSFGYCETLGMTKRRAKPMARTRFPEPDWGEPDWGKFNKSFKKIINNAYKFGAELADKIEEPTDFEDAITSLDYWIENAAIDMREDIVVALMATIGIPNPYVARPKIKEEKWLELKEKVEETYSSDIGESVNEAIGALDDGLSEQLDKAGLLIE